MRCSTPSVEELNNAVNNHKAFYDINRNQIQLDTDSFLNHTTANFKKVNNRYQTSQGAALKTTITTEIGKDFERKNPGLRSNPGFMQTVEFKGKVGTFVHETNEAIGRAILAKIQDKSPEDALQILNTLSLSDYNVNFSAIDAKGLNIADKEFHENIFKGVRDVIVQVQNRQKYINKRLNTNASVKIYFEQVIIDAADDIGGTIDMLAVYSDNTASVFDLKTKIPKKEHINAKGELITEEFVNSDDRNRYKMQLSSIQRILIKRYGVKQVVQSRIVPIQVNVPYDATQKAYTGSITKIAYGSRQSPFLAQLAPLPELTGFKDLDKFLKNIETKIKNYETKMQGDRKNAEYYKNKIKDLTDAKVDLLVKHSFNDLVEYATRMLSGLEKLDELSIDKLRDAKDELKSLTLLAGATYEYRHALGANPVNKPIIDNIENVIKQLNTRIHDKLHEVEEELYSKRVSSAIQKLTGYDIKDESGNFIPINDDGFFGKYFYQLSKFENPVFKALKAQLDDAQFNIREKVKKTIDDIVTADTELRKWMKENGKDEQWLINSLIDRDSKSKNVDNLFAKISQAFKDKIGKAKEDGDADFFIDNFEATESYMKWFDKVKVEQEKYFTDKFGNQAGKARFNSWMDKYNLSLDSKGKPVNKNAWLYQGRKDKLKRKKTVEEANYSAEYKYIKSIPALHKYYSLFEKYNDEFRKILGVEYYQLPANFLPNIRKSNIDRLLDNGIVNGTKDVLANLMQELNVREDDMMYGEIDPETGSMKRTIPRFFINSFKDKDGNVIVGEKSYDLTKSLILFSKMAYNYQEMNHIEGTVLAMRDFIVEKGELIIRRGNNPLKDFMGNDLTTKMNGKQIEQIFQSFVNLYLYGVQVEPISDDSSGQYEKLILEAKNYFTMKALGLGFIPAAGSFLAAKTQAAIEGFKGQVYTTTQYKESIKDSWQDRQKFLALHAFFDPMDVHYDFFSVNSKGATIGDPREHNFVKKYVNSRVLLRPFSLGDEYIDEVLTASMAKNYYIDENNDLRRMRNDDERIKFQSRSIWSLFSYDGNEGSIDVPVEKVKKLKIDFKNAVQAAQSKIKGVIPAEDKAYWQTQLLGQVVMHFKSWMPGLLFERLGKAKYNDALQLVEMGRFTAFGQELHNEDQLGAVEFVKSIVLPKIIELGKHIVWYNGSKTSPRIRLAYEAWLERNPQYKGKVSYDEFLAAQKAQMKALIIELRILLTLATMIALLGADFDEDGKKFYQEMWLTRKIAAIMAKTNSEISFTYNPEEFAKMIKNPIPMAGVLVDAAKIISNGYDESIDLVLGEKFPAPFHKAQSQDKTGFAHYTLKVVPGVSQLEKFTEIVKQQDPLNQ